MRKMKKILAWLTVLTVNVSMMPMPTVAAATATDASTALNEETITSDATKEATQAQETAKKAVESATKAAATTAAKKVTTETKKAGSKSKSAASTQSLQDTIEEGIVKDRDQTKIDVSDYDASKAALISMTHNLAFEFAPFVNVNCIAPGFIGTENELNGYDEQFLKEEVEKIMVNRYGDPQEVAYLVKFLVSKEADFINNTVIRIDGGQKGSC